MLLRLDTLKTGRAIAKVLFVLDILSGRVSLPPLLTEVGFRVPSYPTRRHEFFHIDNQCPNYGAFETVNTALLVLRCTASMSSIFSERPLERFSNRILSCTKSTPPSYWINPSKNLRNRTMPVNGNKKWQHQQWSQQNLSVKKSIRPVVLTFQ
jgi:hypothetical protein